MSDIEITKACALAMGYKWSPKGIRKPSPKNRGWTTFYFSFDPLHDDAQAMALVKRFDLCITRQRDRWSAAPYDSIKDWQWSPDLNRAICECVARMAEQGKGGE